MLSDKEVLEKVKAAIEKEEKIGYNSGGSGHSAYKSFKINSIRIYSFPHGVLKVRYSYTLYVETEFTYYPDNPPEEYDKSGVITI